jgi:uncharacterized membrane protein YeaQ/YmgE (transglycosylase-associated protein family)
MVIWMVVGLLVGLLVARFSRYGVSVAMDIVVGIVGACSGGFLAAVDGFASDNFVGQALPAFFGALILLGCLRLFERRALRLY